MNRLKLERRGKRTAYYWVLLTALTGGMVSCSSARKTSETAEDPIEVTTTPATIETDEQRQQIYNNGVGSNPEQLPKPNLNDRASEVNRKRNIEDNSTDRPALTPNEARPQEIRTRTDTVPGIR
ncbi:hypothetical protein [Adhaeribacter radiodurans]|uniref:Uncharacterized protein n=1 Tax=Adhaeribacter radiodurans TaxID=2745197 RepID=A0A7L7L9T6_9BACT|nr:hypothetical protein [Adhaeribacter radiodurans]QMU29601.1 hypothetical protein HUW48_16865 [Adhaeribacter radiodurans]